MDLRHIGLLSSVLVSCLVLHGCGGSSDDPDGPTPTPGTWNRTSTTRYWDCSGGACGFTIKEDSVECPNPKCTPPFPGEPTCSPHSWAPQWVNYKGEKVLFAAAAASDLLYCGKERCDNDGWGDGSGCGKCYMLANPGNCETGAPKLKKILLRTSNLCPGEHNAACDKKFHFDISAPGFDHASTSTYNVCNNVKREQDCDPVVFGSDACANIPFEDCDCTKVSKKKVLIDGCNNFKMLGWDNCQADFMEVPCPEAVAVEPPALRADHIFRNWTGEIV